MFHTTSIMFLTRRISGAKTKKFRYKATYKTMTYYYATIGETPNIYFLIRKIFDP